MTTTTDRIAQDLLRRVQSGEWGEGEKLPTIAELLNEYGVAAMTLRRAQDELRTAGVLRSERGRGVYVTSPLLWNLPSDPETDDLGAPNTAPTLGQLGLFVEWMANENIEPSEMRRAVEKLHLYRDWLTAARNDIPYDEMEYLQARAEQLRSDLSKDWSIRQNGIDLIVVCPHKVQILDTEAARVRGKTPATCPHGCTTNQD